LPEVPELERFPFAPARGSRPDDLFDRTIRRSDESTSVDKALVIRRPTSLDVPGIAALFAEMQRHYRRPVTDEQALEAATLACLPAHATFDPRVLIAVLEDTLVGSIVLNVTFPAFELTRALYIRDLYVSRSSRRYGVGQALVKAAAALTYTEGFSALDWTTETDNSAARQMYESCGARVLPRTYYRLVREVTATDE
jgi:GNAT superfamily N-acetyltransferase